MSAEKFIMDTENFITERQVHDVFPGIQLIYDAVHTEKCPLLRGSEQNVIEIHHCKEGRIEQQFDDEYYYLMPGDLSISIRRESAGEYYFPLKHYHGITITIDTDIAPQCFSCFLRDVDVQPKLLAEKLCGNNACFVIRSKDYIRHIFSELYEVPKEIQQGYFKIKILELLLFLKTIDVNADESSHRAATVVQAELAKKVSRYLLDHMDERVTVKQLSDCFHISEANIKTAFKVVYGVPVYAFVKTQKMESASIMLEYTDKSITEIAGEHGYDNSSKFASAFRDVKGASPTEYRALHYQR